MLTDIKMAEMLCTRLCHDITGPVGAIANGAEFLTEGDPSMQEQAIELVANSAEEAVSRLQFYRMAYGRVGQGGEVSLADCKELIRNFFGNGKTSLEWVDSSLDAVSRQTARLLYNLVVLASGVLIRGGVVSIRIEPKADKVAVQISASGRTLRWDEKIQRALRHEVTVDDLEPTTVQAYFTGFLAKEAQVKLEISQGMEVFEIVALQQDAVYF
jgi:histidine phosphotransferase ChpT